MPFIKPHLLKMANAGMRSFSIRHDVLPYFYNQYHYHPEVELLYIESGTGTQFVGDSIQRFNNGDLLLIGSGCPHYLRSDNIYFNNDPSIQVSAIVIHFNPSLFGEGFLSLPENKYIEHLIDGSKKGMRLSGALRSKVIAKMSEMLSAKDGNMVLELYKLLDIIAMSNEYEMLGSTIIDLSKNVKEADRLNRVYNYAAKHFKRKISITEIARVANLSAHSFCRYFKKKTKKSFSHFMNEIRIEYACKLIRERQLQMTQVCYEAGFNNFPNFNNAFKKIIGRTPLQFSKEFSEQ